MDLIRRKTAIEALARMMPRSYTPDGSHPADEEIFRVQEVFADCIKSLEILPSAQPEIIRCKDCKHYQFADNRAFGFPVKRCEWTGFEDVDDDDFCSRGERKDD